MSLVVGSIIGAWIAAVVGVVYVIWWLLFGK
jgi:hypothetical protein